MFDFFSLTFSYQKSPQTQQPHSPTIRQFWHPDKTKESIRKLNISISKIQAWTDKWRIELNESKSVHVDFTNKKINYVPVYVNGKLIPYSNQAKYLDMTLDVRLRWKHMSRKREN